MLLSPHQELSLPFFCARLRCDRDEPCSNCTARNVDCIYASLPRGRGSLTHRGNHKQRPEVRLRKLEQLLGTIVSQMPEKQASGVAISSYNAGEANNVHGDQTSSPAPRERIRGDLSQNDHHTVRPGRMMSSDDQTIYVSSVHWAAICNEVRSHLRFHGLCSHNDTISFGTTLDCMP